MRGGRRFVCGCSWQLPLLAANEQTGYLASFRMSDSTQQLALEELLPAFVGQTYQPTSTLDKHNPDGVWGALRLLLRNFPVRAADLARFREDRGGGSGGAGGGGGSGSGGSLNPAKPNAKLPVKPDAKSPAVAKTVTFARPLPSRRPGAQDRFPQISCYNCGAKGHYSPQCARDFYGCDICQQTDHFSSKCSSKTPASPPSKGPGNGGAPL